MALLTKAKIDREVKKKLQSENPRGRLKDGRGLYLDISKGGTTAWILKIQVKNGPRVELGLGGYPVVSIEKARAQADDLRYLARSGINPKTERHRLVPRVYEP